MTREEIRIIITKYSSYIYGICLSFIKNPADAENITQETFISAYTHPPLAGEDNYKAYLAKIAINKCKDHLKSAYAKRVIPDDDLKIISQKPTLSGNPEKTLIDKESLETIKKEIFALKEPYKTVAIMYFLEEKKIGEISSALGRPPNTIGTQLFRAKSILRKKLSGRKEET